MAGPLQTQIRINGEIRISMKEDRGGAPLTCVAVRQCVEVARDVSPSEETHHLGLHISIGRLGRKERPAMDGQHLVPAHSHSCKKKIFFT